MDASTQLPLLFPFAIKLTWRARHQGEGLVSWLPVSLAGKGGWCERREAEGKWAFSGVQHTEKCGTNPPANSKCGESLCMWEGCHEKMTAEEEGWGTKHI